MEIWHGARGFIFLPYLSTFKLASQPLSGVLHKPRLSAQWSRTSEPNPLLLQWPRCGHPPTSKNLKFPARAGAKSKPEALINAKCTHVHTMRCLKAVSAKTKLLPATACVAVHGQSARKRAESPWKPGDAVSWGIRPCKWASNSACPPNIIETSWGSHLHLARVLRLFPDFFICASKRGA